jgi:hypothetical protein
MPTTINIFNINIYDTQDKYLQTKNNIKNININRKTNCSTPFRMPYKHYRKVNNTNNCEFNTNVLKDNHSLYCCYDPYIRNIQNPGGKISNNFLYSNKNYMYKKHILYNQNTISGFQSSFAVDISKNEYQVTPFVKENNIITLLNQVVVNVLLDTDNSFKYAFGRNYYDSTKQYGLFNGVYTFKDVPSDHPIAFLNNGVIGLTYTGDSDKKYTKAVLNSTNNGTYDFYYGDVTVTVIGEFGLMSVYCYYHGYMGGKNSLRYFLSNDKTKMYCRKAIWKVTNRNHNQNGAVSNRSRINRLKYNAINARIDNYYGGICQNRNNTCYDKNFARYRVDIAPPKKCKPYTSKENKKLRCNPEYKPKEEDMDISLNYIFPVFKPLDKPPPTNGLISSYYQNDFWLFNTNSTYDVLEFNTNYNNANKNAQLGPVYTNNETMSIPDTIYNTYITENDVTYEAIGKYVTTVTQTNKITGITLTTSYITDNDKTLSTGGTQRIEPPPIDPFNIQPKLSEIEVVALETNNYTVNLTIKLTDANYWKYKVDDNKEIMVMNGSRASFTVNNYKEYMLTLFAVSSEHKVLYTIITRFTTFDPSNVIKNISNNSPNETVTLSGSSTTNTTNTN